MGGFKFGKDAVEFNVKLTIKADHLFPPEDMPEQFARENLDHQLALIAHEFEKKIRKTLENNFYEQGSVEG